MPVASAGLVQLALRVDLLAVRTASRWCRTWISRTRCGHRPPRARPRRRSNRRPRWKGRTRPRDRHGLAVVGDNRKIIDKGDVWLRNQVRYAMAMALLWASSPVKCGSLKERPSSASSAIVASRSRFLVACDEDSATANVSSAGFEHPTAATTNRAAIHRSCVHRTRAGRAWTMDQDCRGLVTSATSADNVPTTSVIWALTDTPWSPPPSETSPWIEASTMTGQVELAPKGVIVPRR